MKKYIFIILGICALGVCGIEFANATNSNSEKNVPEVEVNDSGWEYHTTVYTLARKNKSMWIQVQSRTGYEVQVQNYSYRINYKGEWYTVQYSDQEKYSCMFNSSSGKYYFNMSYY